MAKAQAIHNGNIDIYHTYHNNSIVDFYPPGFHIYISSFFEVLGISNPYIVRMIIMCIFTVIISLIFFMICKKISVKAGLISMLLWISIPRSLLNIQQDYIYFLTSATYINTTSITYITFLIVLFFIINTYQKKSLISSNLIIVYLCTLIHGLSHISTYISTTLALSFFFFILIILAFYKHEYYLIKITLNNLIVILMTIPSIFFIYYYQVWDEIIKNNYQISFLLPPGIKEISNDILPTFLIMFTIIIFLIFVINNLLKVSINYQNIFPSSNSVWRKILPYFYLNFFIAIIVIINLFPNQFIYAGSAGEVAFFSTYLPRTHNIFQLGVYLLGLSLLGLSFIGYLLINKNENKFSIIISIAIFAFLLVFLFFYIIIPYYSHRMIRPFEMMIPIIVSGIILIFREKKIFKANFSRHLKNLFIFIICVLLISVSFISELNKDPAICDDQYKDKLPLRIGQYAAPPIIKPEFGQVVKFYADGKKVLSSKSIGISIIAISNTTVEGIQFISYYKNNYKWGVYINAVYKLDQADDYFKGTNEKLIIMHEDDYTQLDIEIYYVVYEKGKYSVLLYN